VTGIRYLLDTNVVSEPLKPGPNARVMQAMEQSAGAVAISASVWHELLRGALRMDEGRKKRYVLDYLDTVVSASIPVLPFDTAAAEWLARERVRLESQGQTRSFGDGLIAAVAATRGLILVTRNVKDFGGYAGLAVENWFE
jgi:tRNA(fMet)-specific endonuclease VapC